MAKYNQLSESKRVVRALKTQIVKKHLDIVILKALKKRPMNGYAIISLVHREYGVLLGAGMVYNLLRSMEKRNLIKSNTSQRARYYVLDEKGAKIVKVADNNRIKIRNIINSIF